MCPAAPEPGGKRSGQNLTHGRKNTEISACHIEFIIVPKCVQYESPYTQYRGIYSRGEYKRHLSFTLTRWLLCMDCNIQNIVENAPRQPYKHIVSFWSRPQPFCPCECERAAHLSLFSSVAVCFHVQLKLLSLSVVQALAGPHFYTWGDHGGILMAIAQGGPSTHLK